LCIFKPTFEFSGMRVFSRVGIIGFILIAGLLCAQLGVAQPKPAAKPATKPSTGTQQATAQARPQTQPAESQPSFDDDGTEGLQNESDDWITFVRDIEAGNTAEIEARLEQGTLRPTLRNGIKRTLLHQAVLMGKVDVVKMLLAQGVAVSVSDSLYGSTPLHEAARRGYAEILELLLEADARVAMRDKSGATALHTAAGHGQAVAAKLLLDHAADVNARDQGGVTSLHYAVSVGDVELARLLIERGAKVDARTNESWDMAGDMTPLHLAAAAGDLALVSMLIEAGADINAANADGQTPMNLAAEGSYTEVVKLLKANGAKG
jgi:ankyrin repeat protein